MFDKFYLAKSLLIKETDVGKTCHRKGKWKRLKRNSSFANFFCEAHEFPAVIEPIASDRLASCVLWREAIDNL